MTKDEALKLALEEYLCREMPAGTIIGDPKWWVPKIAMAIREALAQPEQEPVAWISTSPARMIHWTSDKPAYGDDWIPLYGKAQRKPLSDEEIEDLYFDKFSMGELKTFARAIEAAHNIKE